MKYSIRNTFSVLACLVFSSWAAADRPSWVDKPPIADASYKYFVGRSANAPNHPQAIEMATKDATGAAIRDNFAVTTKIQSQSYETSTKSEVVSSVQESSRSIQLNGFEVMDTFIEETKKGFNAWILYKYSKNEILKEQQRLERTKDSGESLNFSEVGNVGELTNGQLEIVTEPRDAQIFIDGKEVLGHTPLRITGILSTGEHAIEIEHPEYETVQKTVVITGNSKTKIKETLIPAKAFLSIDSSPSGASVLLNGRYTGTTPLENIEVPAQKPMKIDFVHQDANRLSQDVTAAKNEHRRLSFNLPLRPAQIQIILKPSDATLFIDGKRASPGWNSVLPGEHVLAAQRDEYEESSKTIVVRGGEKKIEKIDLTPWSDIRHRLEYEPWIVGLGLGVYGATHETYSPLSSAGLDIFVEKKFFGFVGARLTYSIISVDETVGTVGSAPTRKMEGNIIAISLPIYVSYFYLSPSYGMVHQDVTCKTGQSSPCQNYSLDQKKVGALLGFQYFWNSIGIDASYGRFIYSDTILYKGSSSGSLNIALIYKF